MRILVFNGSSKREKSDTMCITRAFLEGMEQAGPQETETVNVIDRHIEFCSGCLACMRNGGVCRHKDDMRDILERITGSELLLFSFPLYCCGIPAVLKNLIDRLLPLSDIAMKKVGERYVHVAQVELSRQKYLMICGCGFPNSAHNFEPAAEQFRLMFPCGNTVITVPESPMFNAPEAAAVTVPRLELVKAAGKQYAESGEISAELLAKIGSPMIPEEEYAKIVNGGV